jgi:glycosyltransferase involved in cell wall biosynthesis
VGQSKAQTVVIVSAGGGLGGPTRSIGGVLGQLDGLVHRTLIAPPSKLAEFALTKGWADDHVALPSGGRFHAATRISGALRVTWWIWRNRRRIIVVHANGESELNLVGLGAFISRTPVIVSARAFLVKPWVRRLSPVWRVLLPGARWVSVSDFSRQLIVDSGVARSNQVVVVPNPIDPSEVRADERVKSSRIRVGYLGGKQFDKGFPLLPEVIAQVGPHRAQWLLFTSEPPADAPIYQQQAAARLTRLGSAVAFAGRLADVRQAFARCDIVFSPSLRESFGRIPVEAMANGLPVVAADIPSFREFIGDNERGLLFPPGDPEAAAKAIRALLDDPGLRTSIGERGRRYADQFEPRAIAQRFWELYGLEPSQGPAPDDPGPPTSRNRDVRGWWSNVCEWSPEQMYVVSGKGAAGRKRPETAAQRDLVRQVTGIEKVPGSLNLRSQHRVWLQRRAGMPWAGGRMYPGLLGGHRVAVTKRGGFGASPHLVHVYADRHLRSVLGVTDGDEVTLLLPREALSRARFLPEVTFALRRLRRWVAHRFGRSRPGASP